jgi:hypothetical protein
MKYCLRENFLNKKIKKVALIFFPALCGGSSALQMGSMLQSSFQSAS